MGSGSSSQSAKPKRVKFADADPYGSSDNDVVYAADQDGRKMYSYAEDTRDSFAGNPKDVTSLSLGYKIQMAARKQDPNDYWLSLRDNAFQENPALTTIRKRLPSVPRAKNASSRTTGSRKARPQVDRPSMSTDLWPGESPVPSNEIPIIFTSKVSLTSESQKNSSPRVERASINSYRTWRTEGYDKPSAMSYKATHYNRQGQGSPPIEKRTPRLDVDTGIKGSPRTVVTPSDRNNNYTTQQAELKASQNTGAKASTRTSKNSTMASAVPGNSSKSKSEQGSRSERRSRSTSPTHTVIQLQDLPSGSVVMSNPG